MAGSTRARVTGGIVGGVTTVAATIAVVAAATQGLSTASGGLAASTSSPSPTKAGHHHSQDARLAAPSLAEFRLTMERLLGQHAVLAGWLMRAPANGADAGTSGNADRDARFVDAARGELARNTRELRQAVASVHGTRAGAQFAALWRDRTAALEAYATARAAGDDAAASSAERGLARTAGRYGQLVAGLAGAGSSVADRATTDLQTRTRPLLAAADAYAGAQYPAVFAESRAAHAALFRQGQELATDLTRGYLRGAASQATDMRSALGELFGEHAALAFDASRSVVAGSPSVTAAAGALNANSTAVVEAVRAALGPQAADAFSRLWAAHIDALMQFSVAVAQDDPAAQARARATLDLFPPRLGAALAGVIGDGAPARRLVTSLQTHDQQLLQQVTAFAAEDYQSSAALAYHGYDHMFGIAGMLADALEHRATAAAPRKGAHTGGGGMAR